MLKIKSVMFNKLILINYDQFSQQLLGKQSKQVGSTSTRGETDIQDTALKMSLKDSGTFIIIIWSENLR